jgi:hypothetical protein
VRWNDQGPLPARSRHVIRLLGEREAAVAINPEEGAIDRTLVGANMLSWEGKRRSAPSG